MGKESISDHLHKQTTERISKWDEFLKENSAKYSKEKLDSLFKELKELSIYKEKYVNKILPKTTKPLLWFSIMSLILFIYTGILILRLKPYFKRYLYLSFISGLSVIFLFCWNTINTIFFIIRFGDRLAMLDAHMLEVPAPTALSNLDIVRICYTSYLKPVVFAFVIFILYIFAAIFYFTRPNVKEQFSRHAI
jgi:hypothetical protein